jgi:hypothetical protein
MVELPSSDVSGRTSGQGLATEARPGRAGARSGYSVYEEEGVSPWAWFTGALMGLVGLFQLMAGLVSLAGAGYHAAPARSLVVDASSSAWGWVHLIIGVVALVTGGGLAFGNMAARVVGVALAGLSAIVNLAFIPAAPFTAIIIIAFDVVLIYAITVHGGEPKRPR